MKADRRTFLRCGGAAALCGGMPDWLRALATAPRRAAGHRPMILIWLDGGLAHLDTFDGKPDAPRDIRGDMPLLPPTDTGACLSAHLPKIHQRLPHLTLVRSLTHGEGNHDRASHLFLTGNRPSPVLTHPALGSALRAIAPGDDSLPAYVAIPGAPQYGGHGFLPAAAGPFPVGGDPSRAEFRVPDLLPADGSERGERLLRQLDDLDGAPRSRGEQERDRALQQARSMSQQPRVRELFDLQRMAAPARQRFGMHRLGQACALATRLIEGGVDTVLVHDVGWDHHQNVMRSLTYGFPAKLVQLDDAVGGLVDWLLQGTGTRMDEVLIAVCSEFGRTPRLNPDGGRDHWPRAQSALLAGCGIRGGIVHGSTDARGEEPARDPVSPGDLWTTVLRARGVAPGQLLHTDNGRPVRLEPADSRPIDAILRG